MGLSKLYPRVYIIQNIVQGFDVKAPDTAYEKLFHAIEIGEIGPGERLLEIELAKRFGVSRHPFAKRSENWNPKVLFNICRASVQLFANWDSQKSSNFMKCGSC